MASDDDLPLKTADYTEGDVSNQSSKLDLDYGQYGHDDPYQISAAYGQVNTNSRIGPQNLFWNLLVRKKKNRLKQYTQ